MAQWKGHRYQIRNAQGETVGESRYYKLIMYLWVNREDRSTLIVTDGVKKREIPHKELIEQYEMDRYPALMNPMIDKR